MEKNGTWAMADLLIGKKPIGYKSVYKINYHVDNTIECYKVGLVRKEFKQVEEIDFHETFTLVANLVNVQSFLAIAVTKGFTSDGCL